MTASALLACASVDWACTTTPFIEVTLDSGQQSVTRQPGRLTRLRIASATIESSSLKPWKVRMAMCMKTLCLPWPGKERIVGSNREPLNARLAVDEQRNTLCPARTRESCESFFRVDVELVERQSLASKISLGLLAVTAPTRRVQHR